MLANDPFGQLLAAGISNQLSESIANFIQRQNAPTLSVLTGAWLTYQQAEANLSPKHMAQLESRTRLLVNILTRDGVQHRLASSLTQEDCALIRSELPGRISGQSAHQGNTLSKYYATFNRLMEHIKKQNYVDQAPRIDHNFKRRKANITQPLNDDDLQSLFNGLIYEDHRNSSMRWTAHAFKFWIMPLSLFTGMRLNEICQLQTADIFEKEGGWVISINDNGNNKSLKTESSRRELPIHQALINMGFIDFVKLVISKQKSKRSQLFPELSYKPMHRYSREATRFFMGEGEKSGYLNNCCELGSKDNYGFKSLRRSFAQRLRDSGVDAEIIADLLGHVQNENLNTLRSHYAGKSLHEARRKAVEEQLTFNLDLGHVHWSNYEQAYLAQRNKKKRGGMKQK